MKLSQFAERIGYAVIGMWLVNLALSFIIDSVTVDPVLSGAGALIVTALFTVGQLGREKANGDRD